MTSETEPKHRIRPAVPQDTSTILSLIRELAEYERLAHQVSATEDALRETLFGPEPAARVFMAEWEGNPAGFALFFFNYSTFLAKPGIFLEDLYIKPAYRGRGLGRELLVRLAALAKDRGFGRVEWAVLDWNEPAIRFYETLGAELLRDWRIFRLTGEALRELGSEYRISKIES